MLFVKSQDAYMYVRDVASYANQDAGEDNRESTKTLVAKVIGCVLLSLTSSADSSSAADPHAIDGETETMLELPPPELSISTVVEYLSEAV